MSMRLYTPVCWMQMDTTTLVFAQEGAAAQAIKMIAPVIFSWDFSSCHVSCHDKQLCALILLKSASISPPIVPTTSHRGAGS
jgi:hypothetical protein